MKMEETKDELSEGTGWLTCSPMRVLKQLIVPLLIEQLLAIAVGANGGTEPSYPVSARRRCRVCR